MAEATRQLDPKRLREKLLKSSQLFNQSSREVRQLSENVNDYFPVYMLFSVALSSFLFFF